MFQTEKLFKLKSVPNTKNVLKLKIFSEELMYWNLININRLFHKRQIANEINECKNE